MLLSYVAVSWVNPITKILSQVKVRQNLKQIGPFNSVKGFFSVQWQQRSIWCPSFGNKKYIFKILLTLWKPCLPWMKSFWSHPSQLSWVLFQSSSLKSYNIFLNLRLEDWLYSHLLFGLPAFRSRVYLLFIPLKESSFLFLSSVLRRCLWRCNYTSYNDNKDYSVSMF